MNAVPMTKLPSLLSLKHNLCSEYKNVRLSDVCLRHLVQENGFNIIDLG